jgi:plastocyanin
VTAGATVERRVARALRHVLIGTCAALAIAGAAVAAPVVHVVAIDGFEFKPAVVTVKQGDIVEWQNRDPLPHTATAKVAKLDSGEIATGARFRFTAGAKGRIDYICTLHPTMKGTVVVE